MRDQESRLDIEPEQPSVANTTKQSELLDHPDMVPIVQPDVNQENQENQPPLDYDPYTPGPVTPFTPGPIEELVDEKELEKELSPKPAQVCVACMKP